ncbi:hypothetical protein BDW62DRAFT_182132 [Aspergillus aurantiobrunneus]
MMNYQKYYPVSSTYPPHTLSLPTHDPRFAPSLPPAPPASPAAVAAAAAPPRQPPAPPPPGPSSGSSSSSYSHRPLRPSHDPFDRPQHDMPRSARPSAAYQYPQPDGTPALTRYSADDGYATLRRGESAYHVSQANHGSRKRLHRDEGIQGASPGLDRNRRDWERPAVYREGESAFITVYCLSMPFLAVLSPLCVLPLFVLPVTLRIWDFKEPKIRPQPISARSTGF